MQFFIFKTICFYFSKHNSSTIVCIASSKQIKYLSFCPKIGYIGVLQQFSKKKRHVTKSLKIAKLKLLNVPKMRVIFRDFDETFIL